MNESQNQEQMDHLLESKHGASVPVYKVNLMMAVFHITKSDSSLYQKFRMKAS